MYVISHPETVLRWLGLDPSGMPLLPVEEGEGEDEEEAEEEAVRWFDRQLTGVGPARQHSADGDAPIMRRSASSKSLKFAPS